MYIPDPILKEPKDVVAYLVMFFLQNSTFSQTAANVATEQLSFQTLAAKYTVPEALANVCATELRAAILRVLPDLAIQVDCTVVKDTVKQTYKLQLSVTDNDTSLLQPSMFSIAEDGSVTVNYNKT
jgi:hypothetical protein